MRKVSALQPKLAVLQKKYANDRDKLNKKTQELYQKEGVNPLSGCLPMLLSYPILIFMFNTMRYYANQMMVQQVADCLISGGQTYAYEPFLWIKNLFMADSPTHMAMVDFNTLKITNDVNLWNSILNRTTEGGITYLQALNGSGLLSAPLEAFSSENMTAQIEVIWNAYSGTAIYTANSGIAATGNMLLFTVTIFNNFNGLWILPILSAVSQFVMTKLTGNQQPTPTADAADPQAAPQQATGKFMKWFFPIFSLWICSTSTAAFALYWVASNIIMMGQTFVLNKYLDNKEKKDTIAGEGIVQ
jgi:YidC/Oxa1 family membrane protein insertase